MNILFLVKFYKPFDRGGSEWSTYDLAKLLEKKGHSVTIATINFGAKEKEENGKINVIRIPFPVKLKNPKGKIAPFWTNNIFWFIYSTIICLILSREKKYDVIHVQNNEFIPAAVITGFVKRIMTVATFRDYQAICPLGFCVWHKNKGCNLVEFVTKDFPFFYENYEENKNPFIYTLLLGAALRGKVMQVILKFFSKKINRKIAVSKKLENIFSANGIYNLSVINNPVIVNKTGKSSSNRILFIGRLSYGKGVITLLEIIPEVLKKIKGSSFMFIGSGPLKKNIQEVSSTNNLEKRIKLTGQLNHDEVLEITRGSAIVVVPSIWQEPLPRSVIESLLSGIPVVATNVGGIGEILEGKKYGVISSTKAEGLKKAIIYAFKNKSILKKNILKDINKLKSHFSTNSVNSYLKLYKSQL